MVLESTNLGHTGEGFHSAEFYCASCVLDRSKLKCAGAEERYKIILNNVTNLAWEEPVAS